MGCNSSTAALKAVSDPPRTSEVVAKAIISPSPRIIRSNSPKTNGTAAKPNNETYSNGSLPPLRRPPQISSLIEEEQQQQSGRQTASASSHISNISTASKGISYDLVVPLEEERTRPRTAAGNSPSTLPPALQKRLHLSKDSQLTMNKLEEKLKTVKERREKLMSGRREVAISTARPRTALAREKLQSARSSRLKNELETVKEKKQENIDSILQKQRRREERAERVRERAQTLQNPEFLSGLDTFGDSGNIERVPRSPVLPPNELKKSRSFNDDFFD